MQCFFCAEDIKDEAVVCKHCGRDVHHLRALAGRITNLEDEIATLREQIKELRGTPRLAPAIEPETQKYDWRRRLIPAVTASIAITALWLYDSRAPGAWFTAIGMMSVPGVCGMWTGLWWRGRHTGAYFVDGAALGAVAATAAISSANLTAVGGTGPARALRRTTTHSDTACAPLCNRRLSRGFS